MKNYFRILIMLILFLGLSGCNSLSPTPAINMDVLKPQETVTQGAEPSISTADLDPALKTTLRIYPLWVGSSWVYEYLGYQQDVEIIWRVVETVIDAKVVDEYYLAKLERTAELIEGDLPQDFQPVPDSGIFWYLINGENVYIFESEPDSEPELSTAWLELVLPFPEDGKAWYPDPDKRAHIETSLIGFRYASDPFKKELSMGGTYTCYNVATRYDEGTKQEETFCEGVGFVYKELILVDRSWGFFSELIGFSIQ